MFLIAYVNVNVFTNIKYKLSNYNLAELLSITDMQILYLSLYF